MIDVDDLPMIDFMKKRSGERILPRLTDSASIKAALVQYRKSLQADFDNIIQKESISLKTSSTKEEKEKMKKVITIFVLVIFTSLMAHGQEIVRENERQARLALNAKHEGLVAARMIQARQLWKGSRSGPMTAFGAR